MLTAERHPPRRDEGFTLIELLISIAIIGIIAIPLSRVVIGFFLTTSTTTARLGESHDEQIAAAYWQQDVSSIGLRSSTYNADPAVHTFQLQQSVDTTPPCTLPAGTTVVSLAWSQFDSSGTGTTISAAYIAQASGSRYSLIRVHCAGSAVDSTATLSHDLTAVPTVACQGGGVSSCSDTSGAVPTSISLTMNVSDPSGRGQPYSVTLTGQRRQT